MEWEALLKIFQSWGPTALSSLLVVAVVSLIKKIEANGKADELRSSEMQKQLDSKVKEVKEDISRTLGEHGRELSYIKMEYIKRETFHRELSGWKEDINRLSSQINNQFTDFMARLIEIWKDK